MLQFFRKHQKFFFLFVTIIIITSFAFFGTYQAFAPSKSTADEVAFVAIDGKKIKKFHFHHLLALLAEEDAGNFLNDGIVSQDFLKTHLAETLFINYQEKFTQELVEKHGREKSFQPYAHPQAPSLSAESVWKLFAPNLVGHLKQLKSALPGTVEAFRAKVALYLDEQQFPPHMLAQILRYQEREYEGLYPDSRLERKDGVALFGYHNLNDWFGPKYMECLAQVVINGAAVARERGLKVTRHEAVADLVHRSESAFEMHKQQLPPQISNSRMLLGYVLRDRGLDEETLISIWQEVLLFRRLMDDVGSSVVVDALAMKDFYSQAHEKITVEIYQLPQEFRFQKEEELALFEAYLKAVQPERKNNASFPESFDSIAGIEKRAPDLIATPYVLEIAKVSKKDLEGKISVKETWGWENDPKNWKQLQEKFPRLKAKADLEALDRKTRGEVDQFARNQIISAHPEWIDALLADTKKEEKKILLYKSKKELIAGIKRPNDLKAAIEKEDCLPKYTQDEENYFAIVVKERGAKEVLGFEMAREADLLEKTENASIVAVIKEEMKKAGFVAEEKVAPYRFVNYMMARPLEEKAGALQQWNLVKKQETITRGAHTLVSFEEAANLKEPFSKVSYSPREGLYFYKIIDRKIDTTLPMDKMIKAQELLSNEARNRYFEKELLPLFKEKNAIAL